MGNDGFLLAASFTLLGCSSIYAECRNSFGNINLANQTVSCLSVSGQVKLDNVDIAGASSVAGNFTCTNSRLNEVSVAGSAHISATKIRDLSVAGSAQISSSEINGPTSVSGNLNTDNSSFEELAVTGKATLSKATVRKPISASADLVATDSQIYATSVTAKSIKLSNVQVDNNITINSLGVYSTEPQYLTINGGVVNGNIEFKAGHGVVEQSNGAIIKSKIIGATVIKG